MNACARALRLLGSAVLIGLAGGVCAQQDYPNRPIRYIDRISAEIAKLVAMPDTRDKLEVEGFVPYYRNPEQTTELINAHIARFAEIIKAGNIKVEQ